MNPFTLIDAQTNGEAVIVQLRRPRLDENQLGTLTEEILSAGSQNSCRKLVLRFGPKRVECLYSVFLAKLITLQRQLAEKQTGLVLSDVAPAVHNIFRACRLDSYFLFAPTLEEALSLPLPDPLPGQGSPNCQKPGCDGQPPC